MNTKFTPGPWEINDQTGPNSTEVFAGDMLICDTITGTVNRFEDTDGQTLANAILIAAAPDLYAACKAWADYFDEFDAHSDPFDRLAIERKKFHNSRMDATRAAIARAEGRAA